MRAGAQNDGSLPKLRPGTVVTTSRRGVTIACGALLVRLANQSSLSWLEPLVPYLDGQHSIADLTQGLDPARSLRVRQLVEVLVETGVARDVAADASHDLPESAARAYAPELAYIEAHADSPARRFQAFLHSRVFIVGTADIATVVMESLAQLGLSDVQRIFTPDLHGLRCRPFQFETLEPADVVIYASSPAARTELRSLAAQCQLMGVPFVGVWPSEEQIWVGPYPGGRSGCWECATRRVSEASDMSFETLPITKPLPDASSPLATVLSGLAAFEVFSLLTRCHQELLEVSTILRLDARTLSTTRHRYTPHPLCTICAQHDRRPVHASTGPRRPAVDRAGLVARAQSVADGKTGLILLITERGLSQLPVSVSRVEVGGGRRLNGAPVTQVAGSASSLAEARAEAVLRAIEWHTEASLTLMLSDGWIPRRSWRLHKGRIRSLGGRAATQPLRGAFAIGAGTSWQAATCRAVFALAEKIASASGAPVTRYVIRPGRQDGEIPELLSAANILGINFEMLGRDTPLGLEAFLFVVDGDVATIKARPSAVAAIAPGLRDTIVARQVGNQLRVPHRPPLFNRFRATAEVFPDDSHVPASDTAQLRQVRERLDRSGVSVTISESPPDPGFGACTPHVVCATWD